MRVSPKTIFQRKLFSLVISAPSGLFVIISAPSSLALPALIVSLLSFAERLYLPHFGPRLRNLLLPLSSITPSSFVLATSLLLFYASLSSSPLFFHLFPVTPIILSPPDVPLITADHLTGS